MASILSLPDECLHIIVSCIDDPSSFYNIALTCNRFLQVTRNTKRVLHTNLLKAKAEYFIKHYIFEISMYDTRVEYNKLKDLLRDSMGFTAAKGILTYDKVIDVWQRNGPVAATLFTWIRNKESRVQEGICTPTKKQSVTLHLPGCGKNMVIKTSYSIYDGFTVEQIRKILSIQVTFGDVDVTTKLGFGRRYSPEDCMSLTKVKENEKLSRAMEPMKAVIEGLQKELGETVPLISNHFFIWLCYFFPDKLNLLEENRLSFKDAARNIKPTYVSVQTAMDQFEFQNNLVSGWESDEDPKLEYSKMIVETINILAQKSETKILKRLQQDASTIYGMVTYCDLRQLPQKYLHDLVLRTTLEESIYTPAGIAKVYIKSKVFFKCFGGRVMKVCGSIREDSTNEGISLWDNLNLEFTLPYGRVLNLGAPLKIETLSPVTELLEEGVNQTIKEEKRIPELGNFLTAVYFLHALGFSEASSIAFSSFDALIPLSRYPESEEEYRYPESEEEQEEEEYFEEEYFDSYSPERSRRDYY